MVGWLLIWWGGVGRLLSWKIILSWRVTEKATQDSHRMQRKIHYFSMSFHDWIYVPFDIYSNYRYRNSGEYSNWSLVFTWTHMSVTAGRNFFIFDLGRFGRGFHQITLNLIKYHHNSPHVTKSLHMYVLKFNILCIVKPYFTQYTI